MSERVFRLIQGFYILIPLYFGMDVLLYIYIGVLAFEAITNWRVPMLLSKLRYGKNAVADRLIKQDSTFGFESERLFRVVVLLLMILTFLLFPEPGWFVPWFIGVMLLMAGITSICPMVMFFRYLGFR